MKNYNQIKEIIRDVCTPCSINDIKAANKQLKKILGGQLFSISKFENELCTIVWYDIIDDEGEEVRLGWDFWNRQAA